MRGLDYFIKDLKRYRKFLTRDQYLKIKGQAISGDIVGANKGLHKLLFRCGAI